MVVEDISDNTFYIAGSRSDSAFIAKMDANNNVIWAKTLGTLYSGQVHSVITYIAQTGDTIVGCGFTESPGTAIFEGGFVFKMNANTGALYWFKGETTSDTYFSGILINGGQYIITGANRTSYPNTSCDFLAVSAASGAIVWQSNQLDLFFASSGVHHVDDIVNTTEIRDGFFYVTGRAYVQVSNEMRAFVIKMSTSGQVIWMKYVLYPETGAGSIKRFYGIDIDLTSNNRLILGVSGDDVCGGSCNSFKLGLVEMDTSGTVFWSKLYDQTASTAEFVRFVNEFDNGYRVICQLNSTATTNKNLLIFETDFNGVVTSAKTISKPGFNFEFNLAGYANLVGEAWEYNNRTITPISIKSTSAPTINQMTILKIANLNSFTSGCFTVGPTTLTTTVVPPYSNTLYRDETPHPVTFALTAPANNTTVSDPCPNINYAIQIIDSSCTSFTLSTPVNATQYQIQWSTGSTASTTGISSSGQYTLQVYSPATCCYYYDTIDVVITSDILSVNLPNVGPFCSATTPSFLLVPSASSSGTAPFTYAWSTGATSSTLTINTTGWYEVTISNACNQASDSVYVEFLQSPDVTGDTLYSVCNGVSVQVAPVFTNANTILWSNGSNALTQTFTTAGMYWVTASNFCGADTLFFEVENTVPPQLTLPADIDTCLAAGSLSIEAQLTGTANLVWSNGVTDSIVTVGTGVYWVEATNGCGTDQDTIQVNISSGITSFTFNVPAVVCLSPGQQYTIDPVYVNNGSGTQYQWSTGGTDSTEQISAGGWYILSTDNLCGQYTDSVLVTVSDFPQAGGLVDIIECALDSVTLTPFIANATTVSWSNGATDTSITVGTSGTYTCTVTNQCGSASTSSNVTIGELPQVILPADIDTCASNADFILTAQTTGVGNLLWSTGQSTVSIDIDQTGIYWVEFSNACGSAIDSIAIHIDQPPFLVISSRVLDPSCELKAELYVPGCDPSMTVLWNTGVAGCSIEVSEAGTYTVNYENNCGVYTDTFVVAMIGEGMVYVPNSFTPNGDEFNNDFSIILGRCYDYYHFTFLIFDRWGEIVFETTDPEFVWNGTYKGKMCQDGTYTWKMKLKKMNTDGKDFLTGHINLIR
jgi:gliding motility-associated-like protein